jgi:dihydrolipoamide dehydrogenase
VTVAPATGGDEQVIEAEKFLAAFGFAPRTQGFGAGIALT